MKDKDVKKLLSAQAKDVLPDADVKQRVTQALYSQQTEQSTNVGGGAKALTLRNRLYTVLPAIVAFLLAIGIVMIPLFVNKGGAAPTINRIASIHTTQDFYAYGAASIGSILSQNDSPVAAVSTISTMSAPLLAQTLPDSVQNKLDGYLPLAEGLLDGTALANAPQTHADAAYGAYQWKLTVSYPNGLGGYQTYVMYYNAEMLGSDVADDGVEQEYNLDGVLVVNGINYAVKGEHEAEYEEGEDAEIEYETSFTVFKENKPYIKMEWEFEQENAETEKSLLYRYYNNGVAVKTVKAEYENEGGKTQAMLVATENGETEVVYLQAKKGGYQGRATFNGVTYRFNASKQNGKYQYSAI